MKICVSIVGDARSEGIGTFRVAARVLFKVLWAYLTGARGIFRYESNHLRGVPRG